MPDQRSDRSLFPRAREVAYLDTAAEGLPPSTVGEALQEYFAQKATGSSCRERLYSVERETASIAAELMGADAKDVALVGNASEALNLLATSIDWVSGDEIVLMDLEFPSNVLPWLRLQQQGVRVRLVSSVGGSLELDDFLAVINERTRLVTVSHVSYKNGFRIGFLDELTEVAHRRGALLCVDVTQALGRVPVSVGQADYVVASSYKWTLGCHGVGVAYLAPNVPLRPAPVGWYSVSDVFRPDRFEGFTMKADAGRLVPGMPNFPGIYALRTGLEHIRSVGVERIDDRLAPLVADLRSGIEEMGHILLTPPEAGAASGIVSFAHDSPERIGAQLAERNVIVWAGDGRVRLSLHLYNDASDIEACLDALAEIGASDSSLAPSQSSAPCSPDGLVHT